jgi:hypothetical protein
MNFLETCEGSPVDGMESVPGAVATGSKPTAIIEIAGNVARSLSLPVLTSSSHEDKLV